jgi:hypothetical protein
MFEKVAVQILMAPLFRILFALWDNFWGFSDSGTTNISELMGFFGTNLL